jgi:DNA repair photolyase
VGVAPEPVTVTFTLRLDAVLTLDAAGVTLTVALSPVIVSDAEPLPVG